jgi:hypothetical protein
MTSVADGLEVMTRPACELCGRVHVKESARLRCEEATIRRAYGKRAVYRHKRTGEPLWPAPTRNVRL